MLQLRQNVTIDEMLPGFRDKCGFRQYILSKSNKYSIKFFAMVNSKVFYTGSLELYASNTSLISNKPVDIIRRLTEALYSKDIIVEQITGSLI